ncbi:hypothetical protein HYQ45_002427 [Verticillium longisporum]|uniref:Uncharacterized protein n=1 Tax=Verticillium longisporum TaxID=100787 RepID=A0A8I3AVA1_VERLO|nr:hypothetical protein HYQ45_002427 [Verticillium longisporum]
MIILLSRAFSPTVYGDSPRASLASRPEKAETGSNLNRSQLRLDWHIREEGYAHFRGSEQVGLIGLASDLCSATSDVSTCTVQPSPARGSATTRSTPPTPAARITAPVRRLAELADGGQRRAAYLFPAEPPNHDDETTPTDSPL